LLVSFNQFHGVCMKLATNHLVHALEYVHFGGDNGTPCNDNLVILEFWNFASMTPFRRNGRNSDALMTVEFIKSPVQGTGRGGHKDALEISSCT
jgi:hypothetical protein